MADYEKIREDPTVAKWLNRLGKEASTEKAYLMALEKYVRRTKMSPKELIEEAKREEKEHVHLDDLALYDHLTDFRNYLKKEYRNEKTGKPLVSRQP
ncbi:MAG TPA: hypothetical protein HA261_11470 [Methanosarcina sp.]|nr:hypothetical protein [Methanosarcina sp.]